MDDQLDAVRIFVGRQGLTLQASVSTVMLDPDPREEGVVNVLLAAGWQPDGGFDLLLYGLRRIGGTLTRLDRTHAGMSLETQIERWTAWLDIALVSGAEDELQVRGVGFDAMVMLELLDLPLSPYLYGGLARGSSKIDSSTGLQAGFRQSGLHDNNAKLGGVASFRYLGELLRPELSNMRVLTAGAGVSPFRNFSIDLIYHQYRQIQAARFLRDARVRRSPNGESPEIGSEIDLVIGVEQIGHLDLEVVGALFLPGTAFDIRDDAWFLATEAEWNF
jgi:alginate production protein